MLNRLAAVFVCIVLLTCSGCKSQSLLDNKEAKALRELEVEPLHYNVAVQAELRNSPTSLAQQPKATEKALQSSLVKAFQDINAFASVRRAEEAAPGWADLEVIAIASPVDGWKPMELPPQPTGLRVLSGFLWWLGGVPGWFIPDTRFNPILEVSVKMNYPKARRVGIPEVKERPDAANLSFVERASWRQYILQFLAPPPLLPPNEAVTRESLIDRALDDIQLQAAIYAKCDFPVEILNASEPFLMRAEGPAKDFYIFSAGNITDFLINGQLPQINGQPMNLAGFCAAVVLNPAAGKGKEREEAFAALRRHIEVLLPSGSSTPVTDRENLEGRYARVYRVPVDKLKPEGREVERVEVAIDNSNDRFTWTLWEAPRVVGK